jgi:hypothetical protein
MAAWAGVESNEHGAMIAVSGRAFCDASPSFLVILGPFYNRLSLQSSA